VQGVEESAAASIDARLEQALGIELALLLA
jgi:hypothetical protein